jgi:hypothetical protein
MPAGEKRTAASPVLLDKKELNMMRRASWMKMVVLGGGLASLTAGCATGGTRRGERAFERELRGSVVVSGAHARSALAGPLHLLHVDYDNRGSVQLYSVARHDGTDADCAAGPALMRLSLHGRRPNPIDADVGAGEVVCFVAGGPDGATRDVRVSWHATPAEHPAPMALAAAFPAAR